MLLEVHTEVVAGNRLLVVSGELDIASGPELAHAIDVELALSAGPFGLDLTGLRFVDSSGARALLHGSRRAEAQGCPLFLLVPADNRPVRRVFGLLGLETVLSIVEVLMPIVPRQELPADQPSPPRSGPVTAG